MVCYLMHYLILSPIESMAHYLVRNYLSVDCALFSAELFPFIAQTMMHYLVDNFLTLSSYYGSLFSRELSYLITNTMVHYFVENCLTLSPILWCII